VFNIDDIHEYLEEHQNRTGDGTDRVRVGAFKIFLDGTQRLHTSAMRQPYPDNPSTCGTLVYSQDQLNEMLRVAGENGMQVAMHAIGDRAVEQAIAAMEQPEARTGELRHRIIHAQTLGPDLVDRLSEVKPYIETQPSFLLGEWNQKHLWTPEHLLPYCDAFKRLRQAQVPITLSSDLPIGALNPLVSIYAGVNRMDLDGKPEGGWMPQEKLSIHEAWEGFSATPAELEYQENRKGKILPGYQADFVLLDGHPLETDKTSIHHLTVLETWHRGEKVCK
jgi:predicted amidohydrolase YtcJ